MMDGRERTIAFALALGGWLSPARAERPYEGFGASTPGGADGETYVVTSLADSGPGTLRDAVSEPYRQIEFAVGGSIDLVSTLRLRGHHLTIDGRTAPPPGITLTTTNPGFGGPLLELDGDDYEVHDVIITHIRVRDDPDADTGDNIRLEDGVHNVVLDHCSLRRGGDGNLDLNTDAHDITVQWCILGLTVKNQLIDSAQNLSLHHNLYVHGDERNPQLQAGAGVVDFVNNVVYDWAGNYGTRVRDGASANLVKNTYIAGPRSDEFDAVVIGDDAGPVYSEGNVIPENADDSGNTESRLPAPPVTEMLAGDALEAVLLEAGAFPRDEEDQELVASVDVTPVALLFFEARRVGASAVVKWQASSDACLFHLHRRDGGGGMVRITDAPLHGRGPCEVTDASAPAGRVEYWLEAIPALGPSEWYGPAPLPAVDHGGFRGMLSPPRPNPFENQLRVAFVLDAPSRVRLFLADAQGRLVARLAEGWWEAGAHTVAWDNRGMRLRPGAYFVALAGGGRTAVQPVVLVR
jgi:hypothetical protein